MVQITIKKSNGTLRLTGHLHSGKKHLGSSRPIEIYNNTGDTIRVCFLTLEGGDMIKDYILADSPNAFVVDPQNVRQGWFEVPPSPPNQPSINSWAGKAWGPDTKTGPRGSKLKVGANPTGNACDFAPHDEFIIDSHVEDVVIDPGN